MTTEPLPTFMLDGGRGAAATTPRQVLEEARHDGLQAVGTILALLEVSTLTVVDPEATATRLAQIRGEVLCLRTLLRDTLVGHPVPHESAQGQDVVDVAADTARLVTAATVGWTGAVGVVADTSSRTTVTSHELRRILCNLLRNAVRAAGPEGQVRVTVSSTGGEVQIEIEDDGPGFGALTVRHGIGLRSVRRLVQDAGGWLETGGPSRLGGATVRVHLPAFASGAES